MGKKFLTQLQQDFKFYFTNNKKQNLTKSELTKVIMSLHNKSFLNYKVTSVVPKGHKMLLLSSTESTFSFEFV